MQVLAIGVNEPIAQNVVYGIPAVLVSVNASAQIQSSILPSGPFANISNGPMTGCYIRCTGGSATVLLSKA
jgi:hypothetical protein